jgi:hypothetical protein
MKIIDHLDEETKKKLNKRRRRKRKKKANADPLKEKLTKKDIVELMGMNRDRYKRGKGGAIRRK